MKKILFVCDGAQFPEGAFRFASRLNELQPVLLTGVFIPQVSFAHLWSYSHALGGPPALPLIDLGDDDALNETIWQFENRCQKNGIKYRVHKDYANLALPELKKESRFADLLLLSSQRFYHTILGNADTDYIADALHEAECPVLVVPEQFDFPQNLVIAYDGGKSSAYALKQFGYLFPEMCHLETTVLYLHKDNETTLPHEAELKELVPRHFPNVTLSGNSAPTKEAFSTWLADKGAPLLIAGSFGRSSFSQLFRKSFLRDVIATHQLPVFVAHK